MCITITIYMHCFTESSSEEEKEENEGAVTSTTTKEEIAFAREIDGEE